MNQSIYLPRLMEEIILKLSKSTNKLIPTNFFIRCGVNYICKDKHATNLLSEEVKKCINSKIIGDSELILDTDNIKNFEPSDNFCELFKPLFIDISKMQDVAEKNNLFSDDKIITSKDSTVITKLSNFDHCGYIKLLINAWRYLSDGTNKIEDVMEKAMEYVVMLTPNGQYGGFPKLSDAVFTFLDITLKYKFKDDCDVQDYDFTKLEDIYEKVESYLFQKYEKGQS